MHLLTCKLCGLRNTCEGGNQFLSWHRLQNCQWLAYSRAIYCIDSSGPRLSGLASSQKRDVTYLPPDALPPDAHQRFDDLHLDPLESITICNIAPPLQAPEQDEPEKGIYAWGFHFHDSCWRLLEQACAPQPVDLKLLWRVLISVALDSTCHENGIFKTGNFYFSTRIDHGNGNRFAAVRGISHWSGPSTYLDPFNVPELQAILARVQTSFDVDIRGSEILQPIKPSPTASTDSDPFWSLPVEIREMILAYVVSEDILSFRLSSRAIASTPLSQYFFRTRFFNGHELDVFFDALVLDFSSRVSIDWKELYRVCKPRIKNNRIGLGETNRLRIWERTLRPLTRAMGQIAMLSELKGKLDWAEYSENKPGTTWKSIEAPNIYNYASPTDVKSHLLKAEVFIPSNIEVVHVSLIELCGIKYVTGLTFTTEQREDIEIGYILPGHEEPLIVENGLEGFHAAMDGYGFRAISPYTGQHMQSEYLDWAGDRGNLHVKTVKSRGHKIERVCALFDEIKMKALYLPLSP